MVTRHLRMGLIGCGVQGRELAAALTRVRGATLVAACDSNSSALSALAGASDIERYLDYRWMLDRSDLDAVIVATSHTQLADAALLAVQSGHHVFCEKPLALSASRARLLVDAVHDYRVNLMVGYVQRFLPFRQRLKSLLDRNAFGKLAWVVAGKGGPPLTDWRRSREQGGGQLLWVGSHLIDQLQWLLARRVERVFAEIERAPEDGVDLTSAVTLRFEGGLCAHFDCSQAATDIYDYVEVMGSAGRGRCEWQPNYRLAVQSKRVPEFASMRTVTRSPLAIGQAYIAELAEFASSIRESRQPSVTGTDALRVLEVLDAISLSSERGQPIAIERPNDA